MCSSEDSSWWRRKAKHEGAHNGRVVYITWGINATRSIRFPVSEKLLCVMYAIRSSKQKFYYHYRTLQAKRTFTTVPN